MSDLKETIADGLKVRRAASDPTDVIRKQEFDLVVAALAGSDELTTAITAATHPAVTVADTDSIDLTLSTQALSAALRIAGSNTVQAAGGPATETFSPIFAGTTIGLAKLAITLSSVRRYNSSDVLQASGVLNADYEANTDNGTLYILPDSNLITESGDYVAVIYSYAQVDNTAALSADANGVRVVLGTSYGSAARGTHVHTNDHKAAAGQTSASAAVTVSAAQQVRVDVVLDPAGNLEETVDGLAVAAGAFSEPSHSHPYGTVNTGGYLSPTDKLKLDGIDAGAEALTFTDTPTIDFSHAAGVVTADVKYGAGLVIGSDGLRPDWDLVAARDHTHPESVNWGIAGSNFRFLDGQLQIWDDQAYAADPTHPWRALGASGGQLILSEPIED